MRRFVVAFTLFFLAVSGFARQRVAAPPPDLIFAVPEAPFTRAASLGLPKPEIVPNYAEAFASPQFWVDVGTGGYLAMTGEREERPKGFLQKFWIPGARSTSFVTYSEGFARGVVVTPEGAVLILDHGERGAELLRDAPPIECAVLPSAEAFAIANEAKASRRRVVGTPGAEDVTVRLMIAVSAESVAADPEYFVTAQALVDQVNVIASDSGHPNHKALLVATVPVSLAPTGSRDHDVFALQKDEEIASLRLSNDVDDVAFMTESDRGGAFSPGSFEEFAPQNGFFVFPRQWALLSGVFAHEYGHTLGMKHQKGDPEAKSSIAYAFGYVYHPTRSMDLMAQYGDEKGYYEQAFMYSTTAALWKGAQQMGDAEADNAKLLDEKLVSRYHEILKQRRGHD